MLTLCTAAHIANWLAYIHREHLTVSVLVQLLSISIDFAATGIADRTANATAPAANSANIQSQRSFLQYKIKQGVLHLNIRNCSNMCIIIGVWQL